MKIPRPKFNEYPYSPEKLESVIRAFSEWSGDSLQIKYLQKYLKCLEASRIVVEHHYVDRDYIEDFSAFYSRCFSPILNHCIRLHFFQKGTPTLRKVIPRLQSGGQEGLKLVGEELSSKYLGFIVVRPLPGCPVGRTVLRYKTDDPNRHITVVRRYVSHLAGIPLNLKSLAFQQQDRAVSACATTALWAATQKAAFQDDMTVPSPTKITQCASKAGLVLGRIMPAEGLTIGQMCQAIAELGLSPVLRKVEGMPIVGKMLIHTYLKSGMPVIAALKKAGDPEGHAVVIVGYRIDPSLPSVVKFKGDSFNHDSAQISKLYIHDDRLGPFARAELSTIKADLNVGIGMPNGSIDKWSISHLVVPLYPKIRLSAETVLDLAKDGAQDLVDAGADPSDVRVDEEIIRGFEYAQRLLLSSDHKSTYIWDILSKISLSRYVGVVRVGFTDQWIFEKVVDTTGTVLDDPSLTIVKYQPKPEK
jgi:hypothetical protein